MKYLVVGAGGCGGSIAALLAKSGQDVTVIARGKHLEAMQKNGLKMETPHLGDFTVDTITACDMETYEGTPEVVFVCVKGYSIESILPFLKRVCKKDTLVVPILNIYGTGSKLQKELPESTVLDGCIYIAAMLKEPGVIQMMAPIFKVVYGARNDQEITKEMFLLREDLTKAGITPVLSDQVARDTFQKYSYVAPVAACGLYFDSSAGLFQNACDEREFLKDVMREIDALATAMEIPFLVDIVKTNMDILDSLTPDTATSMQRDIWAGKESEIDGLVFEPVRMGKKYGVPMPKYELIAKKFGYKE